MKILAVNSGSSSIKYRIFDSEKEFQLLQHGVAERIGHENSSISKFNENQLLSKENIPLPDYHKAMQTLFKNEEKLLESIDAVGHRIVHGGEEFKGPALINKEVVKSITKLAEFAPLHCEPNLIGIKSLQKLLPSIPQVAVFDTSAYSRMDSKAFLYGIPIEYYEKYKIRKYGFHGINHSYVAHEAARLIGKPLKDLKIITCHLGNGCSISAFKNGKSIDNSMGLTPLEGLVMGTRCGDLDPSVVLYLLDDLKLETNQVRDLLNKKSGLLGLCGKSDMRDVITMANEGHQLAKTAIEVFVYRIQKYIGGYVAALNGIDALVFSAGIGENSPSIRAAIIKNFSYLGISIDVEKNERNERVFSPHNSPIFLLNIPANEEKVIAQQTFQLVLIPSTENKTTHHVKEL